MLHSRYTTQEAVSSPSLDMFKQMSSDDLAKEPLRGSPALSSLRSLEDGPTTLTQLPCKFRMEENGGNQKSWIQISFYLLLCNLSQIPKFSELQTPLLENENRVAFSYLVINTCQALCNYLHEDGGHFMGENTMAQTGQQWDKALWHGTIPTHQSHVRLWDEHFKP
jgi:hypothetical protein